ncbi:hypothetical protein [Humidisolicoccus flavus]|uniref:hypothetical protein n=1 Tax=Humidisolicoccus flavus TaxID=3111414 RepID=UPI0032538150
MVSSSRQAMYRRRRTTVVALLILIVAVVGVIVWSPWSGAASDPTTQPTNSVPPTPSASQVPTPSQTPTPTPTPTPTERFTPVGGTREPEPEVRSCEVGDIKLVAVTNQSKYEAGAAVEMSFEVTNTSDSECSINVGTRTQEYTIRTGDEVVYRSSDCAIDPVDQVVELEPDVTQTTIPVEWDQTVSATSTCATERPQVVAGGASYHLHIEVAGIASENDVQFILE